MQSFSLCIKRTMDVALSITVLIMAIPLLLVMLVLVKLSSPGPVFFIQKRVGRHGRIFDIFKFRTMIPTDKPIPKKWNKDEEDRITPIGRFLRDFGLDELPQIYNILKGDMSIVGPRPLEPVTINDLPAEHRAVIARMRPGVLCLSAVKGRRSLPMSKRIEYQMQYVNEWSLWLDMKIMFASLWIVLGRKNANDIIPIDDANHTSDTTV